MLKALGVDATSLRDAFDQSIEDPYFLAQLEARFDVYITYDHHQKNRVAEAAAIRQSGITAIWIGRFWGKKTFWEQAKWLVWRWPQIERFAEAVAAGETAEISENGKARYFKI
jgi:hypothetical protein